MMNNTVKTRNPGLDIIRCFAFVFVVCVHFFLNSDFYNEPVDNIHMYIMVFMRSFFMICVPLFIMLTGFLMCNKKLTFDHYGKLTKTLVIYALASLASVIYRVVRFGQAYSVGEFIRGFFAFEHATYSWYIEMYIGLFLLCPFLNVLYHGLETQKKKLALVGTMLFITALPSLANVVLPNVMWVINPTPYEYYFPILPDFWEAFYPISYYFIGCYLREYPIKLKCRYLSLASLGMFILIGLFNCFDAHGGVLLFKNVSGYMGILQTIQAVLFFSFFTNLNYSKVPPRVCTLLSKLSELTLGAYLLSWLFDNYLYTILRRAVDTMEHRLYWFPTIVLAVAVGALALSYIANTIYRLGSFTYKKIKAKLIKQKVAVE